MRHVLLLLTVAILVYSQPPAPAPAKSGEGKQQKAEPKNPESTPNREPAKQDAPIVNKATSEVAANDQKQPAKKRVEESEFGYLWDAFDWFFAKGLITLFTGLLTWFSYLQHRALTRQSGYMREALDETRKSSDAAAKSAVVAEKALVLSHRAWLSVGNWKAPNAPLSMRPPATIAFAVKNTGPTSAYLIERVYSERIAVALPVKPEYDQPIAMPMPLSPEAKTNHEVTLGSKSGQLLDGEYFWFFGYIKYRDVFDDTHTIGFCVRYNESISGFEIDGPEGYNYST